jgi:hypothetical protein
MNKYKILKIEDTYFLSQKNINNHEFGHAVAVNLFNSKIKKLKLKRIHNDKRYLAYVVHSVNKLPIVEKTFYNIFISISGMISDLEKNKKVIKNTFNYVDFYFIIQCFEKIRFNYSKCSDLKDLINYYKRVFIKLTIEEKLLISEFIDFEFDLIPYLGSWAHIELLIETIKDFAELSFAYNKEISQETDNINLLFGHKSHFTYKSIALLENELAKINLKFKEHIKLINEKLLNNNHN